MVSMAGIPFIYIIAILVSFAVLASPFVVAYNNNNNIDVREQRGDAVNTRPIIGVLAQPSLGHYVSANPSHPNYMVASYVKWLELSGARVVPIHQLLNTSFSEPEIIEQKHNLDRILSSINGVVFTGGEQHLAPGGTYYDTAQYIFNKAVAMNDQGDYFPIWGTCMGFQLLNILAADVQGEAHILSATDSWEISLPLEFTMDSFNSRLYNSERFTPELMDIFMYQPVTMNLHHWGVYPKTFTSNKQISSFLSMLTVNTDRQGRKFVSSVEAKKYPFYGTQFHSEWPLFEWPVVSNVSHTADAVQANQFFSRFIVSEARRSTHKFPDVETEMQALIYNYQPMFTEASTRDEQTYFFKNDKPEK